MTSVSLPVTVHLKLTTGEPVVGQIDKLYPTNMTGLNYMLIIPEKSLEKAGSLSLCQRDANAAFLYMKAPMDGAAMMAYQARIAALAKEPPWLYVADVVNRTRDHSLTQYWKGHEVDRIGTAFMEFSIQQALDWRNPYSGKLFLFAKKDVPFFYWKLGLRPHPDCQEKIAESLAKTLQKLKKQDPVSDNERTLCDKMTAIVAKDLRLSEKEITPEHLRAMDLTKIMQRLFDEHADCSFLGGLYMHLPRQAQQSWKERMLTTSLVVHGERFRNQLRLELLWPEAGTSPKPVRDAILDYCAEPATT